MNGNARVHLVDDDESWLTALSRLLRAEGIETRCHSSAAALLQSLDSHTRGCVVADLAMPGISGFDLQERLAASPAPMPILFLTGFGDIPLSVRAMQNGAVDFLEKRASRDQLLGAIRRGLARGEQEFLQRSRQASLALLFSHLTPRELEVLGHVIQGRMNKEIAALLQIHERTVKLHRTSLTRKLGVHSSAQLAILAQEAGLPLVRSNGVRQPHGEGLAAG